MISAKPEQQLTFVSFLASLWFFQSHTPIIPPIFSYPPFLAEKSIFSSRGGKNMVALVSQENVVALVSRTGRELQRYRRGRRQVVGCIPYRYKIPKDPTLEDSGEVEVLVISSQKGNGMLFPKGGWELDESKKEAALRETVEEAGVRGVVERELGKWSFKSKTHDTFYEGYMFPLLVQEQLDLWPEQNLRRRVWMSVDSAREVCQHWWMKRALDRLVSRLSVAAQKQVVKKRVGQCS